MLSDRLRQETPLAVWSFGEVPRRPDDGAFDWAIFADGSIYGDGDRRHPDLTAEEVRQLLFRLEFGEIGIEAHLWRIALRAANDRAQQEAA